MKKIIFKYFDESCYGELCEDGKDNNWFKPNNDNKTFGYSMEASTIFYNEELQDTTQSMFSISRTEFKEVLGKWFEDRYKLPVMMVI